ncbi:MAG: alpha/beta hydrolase [Bacteroidota bacterium]|nr:alpha/beta hydrolase [Flavisolibacter sp.]MBD0294077.1 alpha/beta hydrolase [Flavisolibacter sp.]MBD0350960.1 alpha/beta hydrolase [Flavisolibacter sp.]MBD0374581.1 alpha/beta hydrolase [Flavisolibacter sp.]MDQ3844698.1 alpha/beta hydrolase [Bacteroidota bacterium]
MKKIILLLLTAQVTCLLPAQSIMPLYDGNIPNTRPGSKVTEPTLTVFLPTKEKANGAAVIICPGGGYASVVKKKEGDDVAKLLVEWGVTAFVLTYRLPNDTTMVQKEIGPLQDAQQAIQLVRLRAKEWNINTHKIGIMGFSAGGHLAAMAGTHFNKAVIPNTQHVDLRPDFMILAYPVISFTDSLAHGGSRSRLLGEHPTNEQVQFFSNELHVTQKTPPTFLVHAKDDNKVKVENSIVFYNALKKNNVPAEIHLYEKGSHGFGLNNTTSPEKWTDWLRAWMSRWL